MNTRTPDVAPREAPPQTWQVVLTVVEGPHNGLSFSFHRHDTFVVGRAAEAHFCLPEKDPYVSRHHFFLEVNPPLCRLVDMNSHNGTRINGEKVATAFLKPGDRITAGITSFRVEIRNKQAVTLNLPEGNALESPSLNTESLLERQQKDWAKGQRRSVEEYLAAFPGLEDHHDLLLEVIVEEIMLRCQAGEKPDLEDYHRRFPSLGKAIDLALMADLSDSSTNAPPEAAAACFPSIPGYRVEEQVGKGGMGVVYRAVSLKDNTEVAIKTILPTGMHGRVAVERFLREARILEDLRHPHIVGFRANGESKGLLYFAMDFVRGTNGNQFQATREPLPISQVVRLGQQMLDALAYAHARGFVHRDIKPENLLISQHEGQDWLQIADFGLAKTYQTSPMSGLTMVGSAAGTPAFMPPEQILDFRSVQPAADQYAAAATLYFLLAGRPPFGPTESVQAFFKKVLQQEPIPLRDIRPDVPPALANVLKRAMSRDTTHRFAGVAEFGNAIAVHGG